VQAHRTEVVYPEDKFAQRLRAVAALIAERLPTRVYSVTLSGFDTHSGQRPAHDLLLRNVDEALGCFLRDLHASGTAARTIVLVYSEFGRRVRENGSQGTDHGMAAPTFVLGPAVAGGLYGAHPSLTALDAGDLVHTIDFRSVYATLIEDGFGVPHEPVLGASYPRIPLLRKG
jgi:uncharacterized protein (DUF1501 family)